MQTDTQIPPQMMTQITNNLLHNQTFITELKTKLLPQNIKASSPSQSPSQSQSQPQQKSNQIKYQKIDIIIEQLSNLIQILIKQKLQYQLKQIINQNNAILEHIKNMFIDRTSSSSNIGINNINNNSNEDNIDSFSDIHNIITQQKHKILFSNNLNNNMEHEHDSSISMLANTSTLLHDPALIQKFNQLNKKVKTMQQKYQTNFKSLWNVLSMTQAAVFQHVRENKVIKIKKGTRQDDGSNLKEGNGDSKDGKGQGKGKDGKDKSIFNFWK